MYHIIPITLYLGYLSTIEVSLPYNDPTIRTNPGKYQLDSYQSGYLLINSMSWLPANLNNNPSIVINILPILKGQTTLNCTIQYNQYQSLYLLMIYKINIINKEMYMI